MRVFIVYAHPGGDSFTRQVRDAFIRGLESAGHSYILSDLYGMSFKTDMSEEEYLREAYYRRDLPVPPDVAEEQGKINRSDALVFIFPVFWTEAPAKLVGWFDRVWTYGFAYGENRTMKQLEKGLFICSAGNTREYFEETGLMENLKQILLRDRLYDRVKTKDMIVLDSTSREFPELRKTRGEEHLRRVFEAAAAIGKTP